MRTCEEYRKEIDHMKKYTENSVPVICINTTLPSNQLATAESIGFPFFHFAILRLDENKMHDLTERGLTASNTKTLAHELTHAKENHNGELNAWTKLTQLSLSIAAGGFTKMAVDKYNNSPTDQRMNDLSSIALIVGCIALGKTVQLGFEFWSNALKIRREEEYQAEKGAYETMQKLGYCKALEHTYTRYKSAQDQLPESDKHDMRIAGRDNPTIGEYISIMEKAVKECRRDVDPRTTQDTPNLMRNGSQQQ